MTPTSVMTMLITPAKIGRSMKKCGKFMPIAVAPEPRSFCGWRWSRARFGVRSTRWRLFRHRRDFHSGLEQLQTRRDNFLAVLESFFHNPFSFEHGSGLEVAALDRVIGFHDEGVFEALLGTDHFVDDQCGPIRRSAG